MPVIRFAAWHCARWRILKDAAMTKRDWATLFRRPAACKGLIAALALGEVFGVHFRKSPALSIFQKEKNLP
ncbi:MAG: hypothetical protein AAF748_11535 [Pseudomonadota bacterium]